ncbi:gliding motility-associated C-terminal domain-containing protein [Bacteroidota bacterium]
MRKHLWLFFSLFLYSVSIYSQTLSADIISQSNVTCNGEENGSISIRIAGTAGPFNLIWFKEGQPFNPGQATTDLAAGDYLFANLGVGEYTITVKDTIPQSVFLPVIFISQPFKLNILKVDKTNNNCFNSNDGTISVSAYGGTEPLTYYIETNGTISQSDTGEFTGLAAGEYIVSVEDANGCNKVQFPNTLLFNPDPVEITSSPKNNVTCYGEGDGTIEIIAKGGTGNYEYSIDNGQSFLYTNKFTGLLPGTYYLVVKDENNCLTSNPTQATITEPAKLEILKIESVPVNCFGGASGEILISASGGTQPFKYSINGGMVYIDNNGHFTDLQGGSYTIMVRDGNDCIASGGIITIDDPDEISFVTDFTPVTCFGEENGSITITATGGTGELWYSIDCGDSWQRQNAFYNLQAGDYCIIVKDDNSCIASSRQINIPQPADISFSFTSTNVLCKGSETGTISITATGGNGVFQYSIDGGGSYFTKSFFDSLGAGRYYITVKDSLECTYNKPQELVIITEPDQGIEIDSIITVDISCFNNGDGSIRIVAHGGNGILRYGIKDLFDFQEDPLFVIDKAGIYTVGIIDENECYAESAEIEIFMPEKLLIGFPEIKDISCFHNNDGVIELSVTGGTLPYQYTLYESVEDTIVGQKLSNTFYGLSDGVYYVTVEDANKCFTDRSGLKMNRPDKIKIDEISTVNIDCFGQENGELHIEASGGTGYITYGLYPGDNIQVENGIFEGLSSGSYTPYVFDENGCYSEDTLAFDIIEPDEIEIITSEHTNITCYGFNNGTISVKARGGVGDLKYSIDNIRSYQDSGYFENLSSGMKIIRVIDSLDCSYATDTIFIVNPDPINLPIDSLIKNEISCNGENDGSIIAFASGGTGELIYNLNTESNYSGEFYNLRDDITYTLTITDDNQCSNFVPIDITFENPTNLLIDSISPKDLSCNNDLSGEIQVFASGGTQPYLYSYSDTTWQTSRFFKNLPAGNYFINVEDNRGCRSYGSEIINIDEPVKIEITLDQAIVNANCGISEDGAIYINVENAVGNPEYYWSKKLSDTDSLVVGDNEDIENISKGMYSILVKDNNQCIANSVFFVDVDYEDCLPLEIPNAFSPNDDGINDTWLFHNIFAFPNFRINVYNRKGELVYFGDKNNYPWDGTRKGSPLPFGTYLYVVYNGEGNVISKGSVSIIK